MNIYIETGEFAEHLVTKGDENLAAKKFEWHPTPPITIVDVHIEMKDDYNGMVNIELSNGETVEYRCNEVRGNCGPEVEMYVSVSRPGNTGYRICGNEFGEEYLGNGTWVKCVMDCYINYHENK